MARPKGKLFALIAIFAAIGIVTATGAFTSVSASRTVAVNVTGDASAFLALAPNSSSPNGQAYASVGSNDELIIELNTTTAGGQGVNNNSVSRFKHVFNITNQGTQQVDVSVDVSTLPDGLNLTLGSDTSTSLAETNIVLNTGETQSVGVYVNTKGGNKSALEGTNTVSIKATAT